MGSKTTVKNETSSNGTQTVAPPSWTMPGILDAAGKVSAAISQLPGQKYTGDFTALPNMADVQAAGDAYRAAVPQAQHFGQMLEQAAGGLNTPYNVGQMADVNPVIQAALAPVTRQLTEQILPGIRSGAVDSGAYSGSRAMQVLPQQALADWSKQAADTSATIGYQNYQDFENRRLAAAGLDTQRLALLPDIANASMGMTTAGGDLITQAAGLDAAARQAIINNNLAKNQYDYMFPFQGLDIGAQLLAQLSGNYGTTTSNMQSSGTQTTKTGGLGSVVQGIAGLAGGAASLFAGGGPLGLAAGVLGGGAGGATQALQAAAPFAPGNISQMFGRGL